MNLGISLSKVKFTNDELKHMINNLKYDKFDVELIDKILNLAPNVEEIEKLNAYTGDKELLSGGERFCLMLIELPKYRNKLECMRFKLVYESEISDSKKKLEIFLDAAVSVRVIYMHINTKSY